MTCQDCEHGNHEIPGQPCDCPCHGQAPKVLKRKDESPNEQGTKERRA